MIVSFFNDSLSQPYAEKIQSDSLLDRLKALDIRITRKGIGSLDASKNPLIGLGTEMDDAGAVTKNSYGVFNLSWQAQQHPEWAAQIDGELKEIRDRIRKVHGKRIRTIIWCGMGGSAEDKNTYNALGLLKGVKCYVLDSTDPTKLKCILDRIEHKSNASLPDLLKSTLVVGMAMGMTSYEPVVNLEKLALLYDKHGVDSTPNFLYMTLPGSLLDQFASQRGYRKVELQLDNRNGTAGRHSAPMTRGSLYPLGLCGVNLKSWIERTALSETEIGEAWRLSAFLHAQGVAGMDKVTWVLPKAWAGVGLWTKQDFEESLGKSERYGIKIVIDEKLKLPNYHSPKDPRNDRVFVAVQIKGLENTETPRIALLRRAGYPVATVTLPRGCEVSRYMQWIHYAVFGIGYLREMNFVTQPSVELYKSITNKLYAAAQEAGGLENTTAWKQMRESTCQATWRGRVTLFWDRIPNVEDGAKTAPEIYGRLLGKLMASGEVDYGELTFFGDMRYSDRGRILRKTLNRAGENLFRSRLKAPVDVYEGPAMNHSYHEMIIGHGKCLSTVLISDFLESIPAIGYTAEYHRCQFLATLSALAERGRPVVAIALKDLEAPTFTALDEFFRQAAKHVTL